MSCVLCTTYQDESNLAWSSCGAVFYARYLALLQELLEASSSISVSISMHRRTAPAFIWWLCFDLFALAIH